MDLIFDEMNKDLRIALIDAHMREAIDSEWTDAQRVGGLQAIMEVPDGAPLGVNLLEGDEEIEDEDLPAIKLVDRMIDFHFGNL